MKKMGKMIALLLSIGMLVQSLVPSTFAYMDEKNVALPGADSYIHLTQYVEHVKDDVFKVALTVEPLIKSNGGDFVMLIDVNENMLKQKVDGRTYFDHALDAAYKASEILLDPTHNPLEGAGANKNRVWIIFYNGQAYNTDGSLLTTGTKSTAFCYISQQMFASPALRSYPGVNPPASQLKSFASMKDQFSQLRANTAPFTTQPGLFNQDITADKQRYTAVGLAAAYDVFADFSGKSAKETNRKVVMLLSNGPDYERDDAFATNSDYVPQEGSMRMEALFIAKALKFQTHAYDASSTDTAFGVSSEGNLKTAASSLVKFDGNTYYKNMPINQWASLPLAVQNDLITKGANFGNGLPLPIQNPLTESMISLDTHKIAVGHIPQNSNPFDLIFYKGLDSTKDPFQVNNNVILLPKATMSEPNSPITKNYQYQMFGNFPVSGLPAAATGSGSKPLLSGLNASGSYGGRSPRVGYLEEHGIPPYPFYSQFFSLQSHMYTYADHNQVALKETYKRIASKGGMSAEIWSVGLFGGNSTNTTNPGIDVSSDPLNKKEMISVGQGFGYLDPFNATRWQQGKSYRTDFTEYTSSEHTLRQVPANHDPYTGLSAGWREYSLVNADFTAGGPWGGMTPSNGVLPSSIETPNSYTISYIPEREVGGTAIVSDLPGTLGTGDIHQSQSLDGTISNEYKVDKTSGAGNAKWFESITWGTQVGITPTPHNAFSSGIESTQNNDTQWTISTPNTLPYTIGWRANTASIPSFIRLSAQNVPYNNGVNFVERDNLFQQLKAISTVQASTMVDGAGFDETKPWINKTRIWTARQAYLTTTQKREEGLITKATITDVSNLGSGVRSSYSVVKNSEGMNSYNCDWQNFYESFQVHLLPSAYYTAIAQTLSTDRENHPLSKSTTTYDKIDFAPIVSMIEGPSLIAKNANEDTSHNKLVRAFEEMIYNYYGVSTDSDAYIELSNEFQVIHYEAKEDELRLYNRFATNVPAYHTQDRTSVSRKGQRIHWKFDKPILSGGTYGLIFFVKMDSEAANNYDIYYPLQINSYINFNIKTLTRDQNDNLIRLNVIKNFPYSYVKGFAQMAPFVLNDVIVSEEPKDGVQLIGIFPNSAGIAGAAGGMTLPENLPIPYYTASQTASPKKPKILQDEKVDEGVIGSDVMNLKNE